MKDSTRRSAAGRDRDVTRKVDVRGKSHSSAEDANEWGTRPPIPRPWILRLEHPRLACLRYAALDR